MILKILLLLNIFRNLVLFVFSYMTQNNFFLEFLSPPSLTGLICPLVKISNASYRLLKTNNPSYCSEKIQINDIISEKNLSNFKLGD